MGRELLVEFFENDIDVIQNVDNSDVTHGEKLSHKGLELSEAIDPPKKPVGRLKFLKEPLEHGPTIIYVPTRKETSRIAKYLCMFGVKAAAYNAGVIVATIAFGMGIDKSNVRRIIHYGWPQPTTKKLDGLVEMGN